MTFPDWIPCAERLPAPGQFALCCGRVIPKVLEYRVELGTGGGWGERRSLKRGGFEINLVERVTHWMPLPSPPQDPRAGLRGSTDG